MSPVPSTDLSYLPGMFQRLYKRQAALNVTMAGKDWMAKALDDNSTVDYVVVGIENLWTYLNYIGYKWWKPQTKMTKHELRFILIDVLHALLSESLVRDFKLKGGGCGVDEPHRLTALPDTVPRKMAVVAELASLLLQQPRLLMGPDLALERWLVLWFSHGLTASEIEATFITKTALTKFRQKHGYALGSYKVMWAFPNTDENLLMDWLDSWSVLPSDKKIDTWLTETYFDCLKKAYI